MSHTSFERLLPVFDEKYDLQDAQVSQYQRDGHILLSQVLPSDVLSPFRDAIVAAHESLLPEDQRGLATTTYDKAFRLTENLWEMDDKVKAFALAKRFGDIAARLLGCKNVRVYHDLTFFKEGLHRGSVTPWHQDGHYWPLETEKCITLWMPLRDCPKEMGPMSFASGSHLSRAAEHLEITDESDAFIRSLLASDGNTFKVWEARDMRAGDATFHSCWTMHAAGANMTPDVREVFAVAYFDADAVIPSSPPNNPRRSANLSRWFPGATPGGPAATAKNPIIKRFCHSEDTTKEEDSSDSDEVSEKSSVPVEKLSKDAGFPSLVIRMLPVICPALIVWIATRFL